jgi:hypothetical protein
MKTIARLIESGRSETGRAYMRLEVDGDIDLTLQGKDLDLDLKPHREKRSLDANAYYYVLLSKMAEKLQTSVNELHNMTLSRYGYPEIYENALVTMSLRADIDPNRLEGIHLKATGHITTNSKGTDFMNYIVMRGSHTFNTLEMSHLIDGVISEAKELGIDTITPAEKERMMALWGK